MSTFTLAISPVWPLPICLDSWTWHSRFLCNIAVYSIGPCIYHQSHPQLGVVFALVPSLHSSRVISPLISSSILGTQWPGKSFFQYPIILPFHSVHGVLQARILKRFAIPFSSGPRNGVYVCFTVHGIIQAIILEWVAFPFSRESSQLSDRTQVSHTARRFFTS